MYQYEPGTVTEEIILKLVKDFSNNDLRKKIRDNNLYFKGYDVHIERRQLPDDSGPDNRISVSYARRIINTIAGYMYKPGLVQYISDNQAYLELLTQVFDENREEIRTEQIGKQASIQGVGYEYHWVDKDATPRFCKLPADEVIPIYDFAVDPEVWAFIRFYRRDDYTSVWFYDAIESREYQIREIEKKETLVLINRIEHFYGLVPLVVYKNNEEQIGDFDSARELIDAYDTLISDSMNEFDRFAWAYLILKGMSLTKENAEKVKRLRIFENLTDEQGVSFLTKTIDTAFIKHMADTLRAEIHRQSGIPNLDDYTFGGSASGETLSKFIYLMELFTDPKESYFKEGLYRRIELITAVLSKVDTTNIGEPRDIEIIMNRNKPDNSLEQAQIFQAYAGHISEQTLIENFADFVPDAVEEMARLEAEKKKNVELYGAGLNDAGSDEESNGEGKGDSEDSDADREEAQD